MDQTKSHVLLIEDDKIDQMAFERMVKNEHLSYDYTIAGSVTEAKYLLNSSKFDFIIADYLLGDGTAFDLFDLINGTPFIFVTGCGNEEAAVTAMKAGAYDYLIKDPDRKYLRMLPVTAENAIKHKNIENQIRMLSHAMMNIRDSVYIVDKNGHIIFINHAFTEIYGYQEKEIIGRSIRCIHENNPSNQSKKKEQESISNNNHRGEFYHKRKDGTLFPVYLSNSDIKNEDGDVFATATITRDITEQKQMENELRRVNRALKTLSQSNQVLVRATNEQDLLNNVCQILINSGGYCFAWVGYIEEDKKKRIVPISKAGEDKDYLNQLHFTWGNDLKALNPVNKAILSGRPIITKNMKIKSNGGSWRSEAIKRGYGSSISLPLLNQGVSFGALTIYSREQNAFDTQEVNLLKELSEDLAFGITVLRAQITHRKTEEENNKIQMQLLQAQKMESIGTMAGGIAHDFNNLLTAIIGCVDLSLEEVDKTDVVYGDLKEIQIAAQRAADLTKQLLLFSRKKTMKFKSVNINRIIQNLLMMLKRLIGENIHIQTHLASNLWMIKADQGTLEQVIMNLVVNARDAMPDGGELTIETENITLTEADKVDMSEAPLGRCIRISVSDKGTGMDKKTIQHIYDPFFSTKAIGKGTGLGLSVVYGIVSQHGGCIRVESEINRGTTFEIYLPALNQKKKERIKGMIPKKKRHRGKNQRILVVEDEEKVREFTTSGLSRSGYTVFSAADAKEAVNIFKRENGNFDVVISDVVLPGKSGIELVDGFRTQKPNIGILLSSGYTDYESRWPIIQENGFQFLEKPYTLNDLIEVIHKIAA